MNDPGAPMLSQRKSIVIQSSAQPADVAAQPVLYCGYQSFRFFSYFHHVECWVYVTLKSFTIIRLFGRTFVEDATSVNSAVTTVWYDITPILFLGTLESSIRKWKY